MDTALIQKLIANPSLIKDSNLTEIKKLSEEYPYFSIAQMLNYGADYFQRKENEAQAAIYQGDAVNFANFVRNLKSEAKESASEVEHESIVLEASEIKTQEVSINEEIETIPSREQKDKEEDILEEVVTKESVLNTQEEIKNIIESEPAFIQVNNETIAEKIEIVNEEPELDIMAMINDLPNSNPISTQEAVLTTTTEVESIDNIIETETKDASFDQEEEDKSLMVMMSFTDWLNHFKTKKHKEEEEERDKKALRTAWQKEKLTAAIEEEADDIPEPIFKQAMDSISSETGIISESLAKVLANQGKTDKAIEMYKKLSLRNPEKSSYFADLIKQLNLNN